ncbi:hypothetical protein L596_007842 [Steinernema carpocapsae]|uniref:Calcineurin-like phosphoesterase domain-containing protein n=1 Tax=Steinernema carpocapsae TaxID=34508 RepID=A0A4U5PAY2_STECR|nr:hypothetical protein L596_007842 [Steinernema carpocapsae]
MARTYGGVSYFAKVLGVLIVGHFLITLFGNVYSEEGVGYEKGTRSRFVAVLKLQWLMFFLSWIIYRQLMAFFDQPFSLFCTHLKPTSAVVGLWKNRASKALLVFFVLSHLTYLLYYYDGPIQTVLFEVCSICLGIWTHLVFFCFGFFVLNSAVVLFSRYDISQKVFVLLRKNVVIREILWDFQLQAVLALSISVVISMICFFASDHMFIRTAELPIVNLPQKAEGLRIAVLSDLHTGGAVRRDQIAHVVDVTNEMNVDAVFIVGDMTDGTIEQLESKVEPLRHLKSRLGTFMVTGNHDYYFDDAMAWIRLFKSYGIKVLTNSKADLEGICLIGLNDISSGKSGIPNHEMDLFSVINECDTMKPIIVLAHNPASVKHISENNHNFSIDLIISGHTHSGQLFVMLPFVYKMLPYVHGLYHVPIHYAVRGSAILLVSAGTLYQGPPMKMPLYSNIWEVTLHKQRFYDD